MAFEEVEREGVIERCTVIQRCRNEYPARPMCRCLKVSANGYYDWQDREPSPRAQKYSITSSAFITHEPGKI